jgi:transposase-like protein
MARREISDEIKSKVIAELLTGGAVNATAKKYSLSPATVSRLRSGLGTQTLKQIETEKQEEIGDLLLILVSSNVYDMKRISHAASEPEYIKKQGAEAVAEIYRALADTTLSILEAATAAGLASAEPDEEAED